MPRGSEWRSQFDLEYLFTDMKFLAVHNGAFLITELLESCDTVQSQHERCVGTRKVRDAEGERCEAGAHR
jgi:hypothetical protein